MTERHPDDDILLELALGAGDGVEADRVSAHLADCPDCHARYRELDEAMREVLVAAPSVAPPAGFSGRVLAAATGNRRTRHRAPLLLAAAAAAVLGLVAGIGGTLVLTRDEPAATAPHTEAVGVLATGDGRSVGTAAVARLHGEAVLLVSISAGRPGATYECLIVDSAGGRTSGGTWTLDGSYGPAGGSGVWLVPLAGDDPAAVELRSERGSIWARAEL